ncbi:MAG TPA: STAS domain-containing protein [Bryobacteraceae bacterium]|nr:STAS domain-containing protein [Bryobacteraceae bacterium]
MPANSVLLETDAHAAPALQQAIEKLDRGDGGAVLDFSSIDRIDPSELKLLEKLAGLAGDKSVKVVLRGVNVRIYKALKLTNLTGRFSFEK